MASTRNVTGGSAQLVGLAASRLSRRPLARPSSSGPSPSRRPAAAESARQTQAHAAPAAASQPAPAPVRHTPDGAAAADVVAAAERESLQLLEWPALCRQVSCFAQTPMGAEVGVRCELPLGRSQAESEALLRETSEAQHAALEFQGVYDVRLAVEAAAGARVLHPLVLGAVATTLGAAARLRARLAPAAGGDGQPFPALASLGRGLGDALPQLRAAIERCIQPGEGRVLDGASPALAEARAARRANREALRAEMERWARHAHARGLAERPQVVVRRDRLCIPVRAGRQGELPRGSVTLAASSTGSTLYVEPQPAVALNNAEAALAAREAAEEAAALAELSGMVSDAAPQLRALLAAVTALDVAAARARHAAWLGAAAPPRFLSPAEAAAVGAVRLPRAWHPLLLQPSLPPLPVPPLPEELRRRAEAEPLSGALEGLSLVPELAAAAAPQPAGEVGGGAPGPPPAAAPPPPPRPVDLRVPPGVRVAAVTGPNTGGKTASLKALGLSCLMAKAGLFPAQAPAAAAASPPADAAGGQAPAAARPADAPGGQAQQAQQGEGAALLWFDRVLADLGDGQSLQQSLSTFGGHVRRLRHVLAAATPQSLVLLDEVGSGTDPAEGAALAAALLQRLAPAAALTFATTHHAELKELAAREPGFVNASVEFDVASLRPTYRLLWGAAGDSNALAVAAGLGFAPGVVAAAHEVAQQLRQGGVQQGAQRSQQLQASLVEQLDEARRAASEAAAARAAAETAVAAAQAELAAAQERQAALRGAAREARDAGGVAQAAAQRLLADVRAGRLGARDAGERLRAMEREAAPPEAVATRLLGLRAAAKGGAGLADDGVGEAPAAGGGDGWVAAEGEEVRVLKMGGALGRVVSAAARSGGKVGVRVGSMTVEVRQAELAPAGGASAAAAAQQRQQRRQQAHGGGSGGGGGAGGKSLRMAARQLRARGSLDGGDGAAGAATAAAPAIQTSRNTVDVRGRQADEAAGEVESAVLGAAPGSALFVVHGVGTGRVRAAVLAALRRHPRDARLAEEEASNGGCTVVTLR